MPDKTTTPEPLERARRLSVRGRTRAGRPGRGRDRRYDPHCADSHSTVERTEPDRACRAAPRGRRSRTAGGPSPERATQAGRPRARPLRDHEHREHVEPARRNAAEEVADAPAPAPSRASAAATRRQSPDGAGRGLRVELVRVVEHGRLGRARRAAVVVRGDRVQELGATAGSTARTLLDQSHAELHVAEELALVVWGGMTGPRPSSRTRPTSWSSAAASRRSALSRGWSCAVSRQSVATPTVCSSSPPAYPWWPSAPAAGRAASLADLRVAEQTARRSRRARGARSRRPGTRGTRRARRRRAASPARARPDRRPAASTVRTWSCSRSSKRSTRPSTRTASPSAKRRSSSSTSFQTRPSMRPLGSTSSSAR